MVVLMVKLGPKGQVLIPKLLRDEFGLIPGKDVVIKEQKEGVLIQRPQTDTGSVARLRGVRISVRLFLHIQGIVCPFFSLHMYILWVLACSRAILPRNHPP